MSEPPAKSSGHGHVTPREDGKRARCGGPALCAECQRELAAKRTSEQPLSERPPNVVRPERWQKPER